MTNINWLSQRQGCVTKVGNRLKDNELSEITRDGGVSSLSGVEPWRSRMAPAARIGSSRCASRFAKASPDRSRSGPKRECVSLAPMRGGAQERYTRVCALSANKAAGSRSHVIRFAQSAPLVSYTYTCTLFPRMTQP